jgi:hypothetical protein
MTEIPFHPLADIFPLMEGDEFDALVADIKANGLREKIDQYEGKIVEGRNRYRALQRLGIDPTADPTKYFRKALYVHTAGGEIAPHEQSNDERVRAYIISKNIHRRHLTAEQRRALIAKLIKAQPEKSDRQVAKTAKVDHKTVAGVRSEIEGRGEIPHVETRTDTRGRKQPAKKKRPPTVDQYISAKKKRETEAAAPTTLPKKPTTDPGLTLDAFGQWLCVILDRSPPDKRRSLIQGLRNMLDQAEALVSKWEEKAAQRAGGIITRSSTEQNGAGREAAR